MKKRILAALIIMQMIFQTAVFARVDYNNWVIEDFESGDISHITAVNAVLTHNTMQTFGGSRGSLEVSVNKNSGAPSFVSEQKKGVAYNISCYIKMKETPLKDQVQFIFQAPTKDGSGKKAYNTVTVSNPGLKAGQWVKVEGRYVSDGKGKLVGVSSRVDIEDNGTVDIRIGNGNIADTSPNGRTVDYYLDDFIVMPAVAEDASNLIAGGDFETDSDLSCWTKSSAAKLSISNEGADGSCVRVDGQSNLSNISQTAPIKFNTDYKITFKAKTDDASTMNLPISVIFDRHSSKTDANIKSYEYLRDENNVTIGNEWSEYSIDYRYNIETTDQAYPNIYLRIGSGTSDKVVYYLDSFRIEEVGAGGEKEQINVELTQNAKPGEEILADISYSGVENPVGYIVFVKRSLSGISSIVKSEYIAGSEFSYAVSENDVGAYLDFLIYAVLDNGTISAYALNQSGEVGGERSIYADFEEAVWTSDNETIKAYVIAENDDEPLNILSAMAVYDETGCLTAVDSEISYIEENSGVSVTLSAQSKESDSYAKVFVFDAVTQKPLSEAKSISKVSDGKIIYVDPDAQPGGDGSRITPFSDINTAKSAASSALENEDVYLMLCGGRYDLDESLSFTPYDLNKEHKLMVSSYDGRAVLSGGKSVNGWSVFDSKKNIYRAYVGQEYNFRQVYVDGVRATRARSETGLTDAMQTDTGYICTDEELLNFENPSDLEMVYYVKWTNPRCAVDSISKSGENVVIKMNATGFSKVQNKGQSSVTSSYLPVYYENAYELLDSEGEWYFDSGSGYLYYKPRFFENMDTVDVVVPDIEKILTIRGTADNNAGNIVFTNIDFMYSNWTDPTDNGYLADMQNNHQSGQSNPLPDAAVELSYVDNIEFTDCTFSKLGITAMKLTEGVKNCRIVGNEFYDISGSAISLGVPSGDYNKYINPTDDRYVVRDNTITDNYIHTTGVDYKSAAAISAAYPKNTQISHNEIYDSPYSGFHLGYGWDTYESNGTATENFKVEANYIHNVMNDKVYDGGAIYTIGNTSGNGYNSISRNYIKDVKNLYGALYPDQGSQYWEFESNVMDLSAYPLLYGAGGGSGSPTKWLHLWTDSIMNNRFVNNYSTTSYSRNEGRNNYVEDPIVCDPAQWPEEAQDIINNSGPRDKYKTRFSGGLQDIDAMTEYSAEAGDRIMLSITAVTGKGQRYDFSNAQIYIENSNPEVVQINNDFSGMALSKGDATVKVAIIEKGILHSFEMQISVV